jgi:7,8-dihydroneopterin aldolase/epimerase/oxygenase
MINIIRIKKASFYGYHGVLSEEQNVGGKFEADVDLYTDFSKAAADDSLKETTNYHEVYKLLYKLALEEKYYLIETLAVKVADKLLGSFPRVQKVAVRIRKNNPPLGGVTDCVEVEIIKSRDEL